MKTLVENIELALTFAGLVVIFAVAMIVKSGSPGYWPILATTASAVGVLHGIIFWIIRRRQRDIRRKTLAEARQMLKDVINNQLAVIQMTRATSLANSPEIDLANQRIHQAISMIGDTLHDISEESLKRWRSKYKNCINGES